MDHLHTHTTFSHTLRKNSDVHKYTEHTVNTNVNTTFGSTHIKNIHYIHKIYKKKKKKNYTQLSLPTSLDTQMSAAVSQQ